MECFRSKFIFDHQICFYNDFEKYDFSNDLKVYEVIRVMNGKPLFLDDHLERLHKSIKISHRITPLTEVEIYEKILKLIKCNRVKNGNIKIVFAFGKKEFHHILYFIPHYYPNAGDYKNGVKVGILEFTRNKPHAKVQNINLVSQAKHLMESEKVFEVLLTDDRDFIYEGSRSNFFAISDGKVYTAPDSDVLLGVTRKKIIELCNKQNIELIEKKIKVEDLHLFQSAFLTGTSPKVLPVSEIKGNKFEMEQFTMRKIMKLYDEEIALYLKNH